MDRADVKLLLVCCLQKRDRIGGVDSRFSRGFGLVFVSPQRASQRGCERAVQ
jgi:hypothetical protein